MIDTNIANNSEYKWLWEDPNDPSKRSAKWNIIRMQPSEAQLLYKYCKLINGNSVEIGRRYGGSLYIMATATVKTVYSIDVKSIEDCIGDNPTRLKFKDVVLNKLSNLSNIEMIINKSEDVEIQEQYDLIFIDGNHTYPYVLADTIRYWDNLTTYAVFHDYHTKGVKTLIDDGLACGLFEIVEIADSKKNGIHQPTTIVVKKLKEIDTLLNYVPKHPIKHIHSLINNK